MHYDMNYDGQMLSWPRHGRFKASSGLPGWQVTDNQCLPDRGPVPEGFYQVFLTDRGTARDEQPGKCKLQPAWGIQKIPRGAAAGECEIYWANWGYNRARFEAADPATRHKCAPVSRGGFYLHDSTKGYSHGCIEVEGQLFRELAAYRVASKATALILRVKYVQGRVTNGGTKK